MCMMQAIPPRCYLLSMREEQRIIADWMRRQLDRLKISAEEWAREAKLSPTTVTRAMKDDYASVTSIPTLAALARVANVASPLDFLKGTDISVASVPSEDALAVILEAVQRDGVSPPAMARGLAHGLRLLARNPEIPKNPEMLRIVAQSSAEVLDSPPYDSPSP